jgi:hypothetical protein
MKHIYAKSGEQVNSISGVGGAGFECSDVLLVEQRTVE